MSNKNLVLAITGASGAVYGVRLLEVLIASGNNVHLTISPSGQLVLDQELDLHVDLDDFHQSTLILESGTSSSDSKLEMMRTISGVSTEDSSVLAFAGKEPGKVFYHHHNDFMAPIASGSFLTDGMVVCPCSSSSLGAIAGGLGSNLVHRAANIHLKEHRKLILVPRETPFSTIELENMLRLSKAGAVILPGMPGFYHGVRMIRDLVDFVVGRICDQLGIQHNLIRRWGEP